MQVSITGRQFTVTDEIKEHLEMKVDRFSKYYDQIIEVHAVLGVERYLKCAEVSVFGKQLKFTESSSKETMLAAIDDVCNRTERALSRFKDKLKGHRKKDVNKLKTQIEDFEEDTDENHEFSE